MVKKEKKMLINNPLKIERNYVLCAIAMSVCLLAVFTSVSAQDQKNDLDARLAEIKQELDELGRKRLAAIRRIENSAEVEDVRRELKETNNEFLAAAMNLPEIKKLKAEEEEIEAELLELRAERNRAVKSAPELREHASALEKAEKAYKAAKQAGKNGAELDLLRQEWDKAHDQHKKMQTTVPEIREIDKRITALYEVRRPLDAEMRKVVTTHPDLKPLREKRSKIEEKLRAARSTETPELKQLRARAAELSSLYVRLKNKKANDSHEK